MAERKSLRALLDEGKFITAPGVYDGISTRFAAQHPFDALYMTGHGVAQSQTGLPDVGLTTYSEMVRAVALITTITDIPLIADADTGFGGLLNVQHTVRGYEKAGAAAIQIEDQEFPKKCGHTPGKRVAPADEMVKKVRVAVESRDSSDFLIIARTDARANAHAVARIPPASGRCPPLRSPKDATAAGATRSSSTCGDDRRW